MNIIKEEKLTEKDYRKINDRLSYSSLKLFSKDRNKFYRKHILNELVSEDPMNISLIIGNLVDGLCLLTPEEFDKKFAVASCLKPTGQYGELLDILGEKTFRCLDCNGELTIEFVQLFTESLEYLQTKGKFKGKTITSVLEQFSVPDKQGIVPEDYYKEVRNNHGKLVVDLNMIATAERLVEDLKNSPYVGDIINKQNDEVTEVHNQLAILFEMNGIPFKALLDKMILHLDAHICEIFDLKTCYNSNLFGYQYYKLGYIIQNGVYFLAVKEYLKSRGMEDFTIIYPKFIVCDTSGNNKPLLFTTNVDNMEESLNGYVTPSGMKVKGVYELTADIQKHLELNEWGYSMEALDSNGRLAIKPYSLVEKEED